MQVVLVEYTYSICVEVPDEATESEIADIAWPWHEKQLAEGVDPPANGPEITYVDEEEYEPVNRECVEVREALPPLDKTTLEFAIKIAHQYALTCKQTKNGEVERKAFTQVQNTLSHFLEQVD